MTNDSAPAVAEIGFAAFARGYREGFAMTLDDVLQYAQAEFGHAASPG